MADFWDYSTAGFRRLTDTECLAIVACIPPQLHPPNQGGLNVATWKRLTGVGDQTLNVNIDNIAFMEQFANSTKLNFAGSEEHTLSVKETPDEVLAAKPLRQGAL